jgi:hypothetical protein
MVSCQNTSFLFFSCLFALIISRIWIWFFSERSCRLSGKQIQFDGFIMRIRYRLIAVEGVTSILFYVQEVRCANAGFSYKVWTNCNIKYWPVWRPRVSPGLIWCNPQPSFSYSQILNNVASAIPAFFLSFVQHRHFVGLKLLVEN